MSSRFFQGSDSSSESSEEEEILSNEEDEDSEEGSDEPSDEDDSDDSSNDSSSDDDGGATGVNRFLKKDAFIKDDDEDSDEEDKVTVVKSAKDKRYEELEATIRSMENAAKINDWALTSSEYDKLNRLLPNLLKQNNDKPPKLFIQAVADLESYIVETVEKQKVTPKKMNALNTKGLNAVRQRIRRNNKDLATEIELYREDKDAYMKEEVVEEVVAAPKRGRPTVHDIERSIVGGDDSGFTTVGAGGRAVQYTPESILKHLRSILEARGRKNTDRLDQIRVMEKLLDVAVTDYQRIRVLLTIIPTRFDLTSGTTNQMSQEQWKSAEQEFTTLLKLLEANPDLVVVEGAEEWEDDDKQPALTAGELFKIPGSIVSFIERLDDELTRSLQHIDPHTAEYVDRLKDEAALYLSIVRALLYSEKLQTNPKLDPSQDSINRIVMRRLEHVYFKPSQVVTILEENTWKAIVEEQDSKISPRAESGDPARLIQTLCSYLFQNSDGIIRARAMLCQIYYLALHDNYYQARDNMLMSHLQETIANFDVQTQILFNRTLVQVGVCAFRAGLVFEAQSALQEICGSNRQKELLAQGLQLQRYSQISPEQERLERQRQLPFHMHINLELLECVYLTCSMLLEIPLLAQIGSSPETRKRVISKTYRRLLEYHDRQLFTGPPENTRDHVMQASKALDRGEWRQASDYINSIKIWDLMASSDRIKQMLAEQIQEVGVRTYLFHYAPFYDTLSLTSLSSTFELPERKVTAIVSKMISHEELAAALDQVNGAIIFRKGVKLSRLQTQALTLADKASGLIESNEKVLEQRTQGMANAFERQSGGGRGGRGGRGGGRGGQGARTNFQGRRSNFTGGALGRVGVQT